ncbi:Gfo/Idh/MocA family protein [candidate division KSB1 bacterium]
MKSTDHPRREFIKRLSLIAGSTVMAGSLPWINLLKAEQANRVSPSDKVRLGVVGVGSRGRLLLLYLLQMPNVEIVAVCDDYQPHYDRAIEMTSGKAKAFKDYRKMLEINELDAVVIAVPLHLHAKITKDALFSGRHVFCEKCMARTVEGCVEMKNAQKETGKILHIGYQRLFNIVYLEALERIRSGEIGKISQIRAYWHRNNDWRRPVPSPELERRINWRMYNEYSRGLMTELACHQLQVANWILEETPSSVMGSGGINYWNDGREVYDNVNLVYTYPSGVHVVYDSMISNRHYGLEEQILGDKGTMELENGKIYSENPPPAPGIVQLLGDIERKVFDTIPLGGASWIQETASKNKGDYIVDEYPLPGDTRLQMEGFVESVKKGDPVPMLLREGFNASIAALLGHEAMEKREIVLFPEDLKI